ncbi:MAG: hypothetical protein AAF206_32205, partial [Bacteroidota bacterium]
MKRFCSFLVAVMMVMLLGSTGCLELRKLSLYDGDAQEPKIPKPASIESVVAPILFADDTTDIWGIVADSCKTFSLTDEFAADGQKSLHLKWKREGCKWVGFGLGWDGYAGKDLTPLMDYAAFQMKVRTVKGKSYGLPLVFTLEDYSNVITVCGDGTNCKVNLNETAQECLPVCQILFLLRVIVCG